MEDCEHFHSLRLQVNSSSILAHLDPRVKVDDVLQNVEKYQAHSKLESILHYKSLYRNNIEMYRRQENVADTE